MIDFIGDIHGHAHELKLLLTKLGYSHNGTHYSHPGRKVIFVGDYIDRGPGIRETLQIVKAMVDSGNALALMGNHEYNAICFHSPGMLGGHLREHSVKNIHQHAKTEEQFRDHPNELNEYIQWFKTLPLFYETEQFRAVHACWDARSIEYLRTRLIDGRLTDDLIQESAQKGTSLDLAIETTLKGKEVRMPEGLFFTDKDENRRSEIRTKWWMDPSKGTYRTMSVEQFETLTDDPVVYTGQNDTDFYQDKKPVFFGHYWLPGAPSVLENNICCVDFSIAKEGHLVAYRYSGEELLHDDNLFSVPFQGL